VDELGESIQELLKRDPEIARAVAEVDRSLIRDALARTPLERLRVATSHVRALRRFKHVPSQGG
jgi:hypothetical protein